MSTDRKIGPEEVAYIHAFCKKKDIVFIDLRIELVDHLCGLIEARWETHPNEDFKTAFHAVYKSFGIFGFLSIAEEHGKTMQKRYWREVWMFFKSWLTPPKVLATGSAFGALYFIADTLPQAKAIIIASAGAVFICSIILTIWQYQRNKKILNGEQNMLMGGGRQGIVAFGYVMWIMLFNTGPNTRAFFMEQSWFVALYFILMVLFLGANYGLLNKAKDQLIVLKEKLAAAG